MMPLSPDATVWLVGVLVSAIVAACQIVGAAINNKRYSDLKSEMRERLARIETKLDGQPPPGRRHMEVVRR